MKSNLPKTKMTKKQLDTINKLQKKGYIVVNEKKDIVPDEIVVMNLFGKEVYVTINGDII